MLPPATSSTAAIWNALAFITRLSTEKAETGEHPSPRIALEFVSVHALFEAQKEFQHCAGGLALEADAGFGNPAGLRASIRHRPVDGEQLSGSLHEEHNVIVHRAPKGQIQLADPRVV